MADYQNGKIYKITSDLGPEVYYGSTRETLHIRKINHKTKIGCTSRIIFEKYGFENCKIDLVENYPCNSKKELEAREAYYIRNNDCVNKVIPDRTMSEWRTENKEKIKANHKQWCIDNKEKIKEYYQERNKEKITCECGSTYSRQHKSRHQRSQKHIEHSIIEKII